jgi:TPP-dependent 2-oxoacid decarboxylase
LPLIGVYWGPLSVPEFLPEIVEEADLILAIGSTSSDYSIGVTKQPEAFGKCIFIGEDSPDLSSGRVRFPSGHVYHRISCADMIKSLADKFYSTDPKICGKGKLLIDFQRYLGSKGGWFGFNFFRQPDWVETGLKYLMSRPFNEVYSKNQIELGGASGYKSWLAKAPPSETAKVENLMISAHLQAFVSPETALFLECGSAWFMSRRIVIPDGAEIQMQMQYGSIGWCLGAIAGYSVALKEKRRVVAVIGDGAMQMTVQALALMLDQQLNPVIFVLNNSSYAIENSIHPSPYNNLKLWNYCKIASAFMDRDDNEVGWCARVSTEKDLSDCISKALANPNKLALIECLIHPEVEDQGMSKFGSIVRDFNMR